MRKWTRRAADRPTELAQAALELCAERGIQATRVSDVADRAGVTVGTIYRYFADKDALIAAALAHGNRPAPSAAIPDRPGAAIPALADAVRRWGAFFGSAATRALKGALSDPRRDAASTAGVANTAIVELTALIETAIARREMRADLSASSVARALVGAMLLGPVLGASASGEAGDADIEAIAAIAARGLRPDGPSWRPTGG